MLQNIATIFRSVLRVTRLLVLFDNLKEDMVLFWKQRDLYFKVYLVLLWSKHFAKRVKRTRFLHSKVLCDCIFIYFDVSTVLVTITILFINTKSKNKEWQQNKMKKTPQISTKQLKKGIQNQTVQYQILQ